MRTFEEFILEARDAVKDATYTGDAAEQERIRQRELKRGFNPDRERAEARRKAKEELLRNRSKNTKVPGSTFTNNTPPKSTQTPSKQPSGAQQTQTPPKSTQTPPKQPSGGSGGTPPPPPPKNPQQSANSSTPRGNSTSSGRTSSPYRGAGVGRTERIRDLSNQSKTSAGKPPSGSKFKVPAGAKKALKIAGRIAGPASAALDVADERSKGSGWARSLAKGAVVAAGGALGGAAGSIAGPVGSLGGSVGGSMAASKAFDVAAGANAKERKAMATANRQRQAGSAVKGVGGKTTFGQKKPGGPAFMSTGSGSQRKTVQLAKTGVVQRGGQSVAGNLAFKGGKAVYKAGPSAQSLAKTSSNPLERVGRSLFAGAYKKSDAANAAKKLATARASDAARNRALGVKSKPAG